MLWPAVVNRFLDKEVHLHFSRKTFSAIDVCRSGKVLRSEAAVVFSSNGDGAKFALEYPGRETCVVTEVWGRIVGSSSGFGVIYSVQRLLLSILQVWRGGGTVCGNGQHREDTAIREQSGE